LLELTGDPNRVVRHGHNWQTGKAFEFSFDSLQFPSCKKCNDRYALFEGEAKRVVEAIGRKEKVSPSDFVLLLDWLDKVRIGLWLGYRYLQRTASPPNFTIDSRLGAKDRMVAIYTIGDHQKGLNTYGPESLLFHYKPSVFSLRVNNILFLNASWDWMCASRCAYPYPRNVRLSAEHPGMLLCGNYRRRRRIIHPVMPGLMKSCVTLFQPIMHMTPDGSYSGLSASDSEYCFRNSWPNRMAVGALFRQFKCETVRIDADHPALEFDSVLGRECNRAIDIAAQAYTFQNESVRRDTSLGEDGTIQAANSAFMKRCTQLNTRVSSKLRNQHSREQLRQYRKSVRARG
jgi:hypothetical protein